jgi:hypothetical protein
MVGIGKPKKQAKTAKIDEDGVVEVTSKSFIDDEASEDDDAGSDGEKEATDAKKAAKNNATYDDEEDVDSDSDEEQAEEGEGKAQTDRITDNAKYVCDYKFDSRDGKWCEISFEVYRFYLTFSLMRIPRKY